MDSIDVLPCLGHCSYGLPHPCSGLAIHSGDKQHTHEQTSGCHEFKGRVCNTSRFICTRVSCHVSCCNTLSPYPGPPPPCPPHISCSLSCGMSGPAGDLNSGRKEGPVKLLSSGWLPAGYREDHAPKQVGWQLAQKVTAGLTVRSFDMWFDCM